MDQLSTFVLTALTQLDDQLQNDDAFMGYTPDAAGTAQLLSELWEIFTSENPASWACPEELVEAWYTNFYNQEAA
jgi:hypothetical protein